ncbi:MAG: tyrosine-type recombinase/integrase [Planctomycetaceae bacterium]|jgi:integrase|nr:tyrosine-type recombinase/integrase [Planctomycetaceae bacterium]
MQLRELYEKHYLPMLQEYDTSPRTIREYETTIDAWENALGTLDIAEVKKKHIVAFKKYLAACPGKKKGTLMSTNTIRKHLRMLNPLLVTASNGTRRCKGLGILKEVPYLDPPAETFRNATDALTLEEIAAWIAAAKTSKMPPIAGIKAGIWWENLLTFIYNTGIRIGSALKMRWSWIDFEFRTLEIRKENGVKTAYTVTLNNEAIEVLTMMFNISGYTEPNNHVFNWTMNLRTLYRQAERQQKLAGIPKNRRSKFHGIRKYFGSEITSKNPAAATKALRHVDPKVATNYYTNQRQVSDPFVNAITPIRKTIDLIDLQKNSPTPPPTPVLLHHYTACNTEVIVMF